MKFFVSLLTLSVLMVGCKPKEEPPVDLENMAMGDEQISQEVKK